ncbi:MAG TPA: PadR family transcriptional regulator [Acidimicrobiales bacterium]|nr:PadR family transcriptional regulator [Acidimicrobiales bacterium]
MNRVFPHGRLRLFLLLLLAERPCHGYELIKHMEDRFLGLYTPSAGTIYPRLAALEEEGLVEHEEVEGRKIYRLTDAGREELEAHRHELRDLEARAAESARNLAREIRHEVKASVRELRQELGVAMRDLRREERRTAREAAEQRHERLRERKRDRWGDEERWGDERSDAPRRSGGRRRGRRPREPWAGGEPGGHDHAHDRDGEHDRHEHQPADADAPYRLVLRSLGADLEAFTADVMTVARRRPMDSEQLRAVREALLAAREAVIGALSANDST